MRAFIPKAVIAGSAAALLVVAGCSSDGGDSSSSGSGSGSTDSAATDSGSTDGRGPITFAMGSNDADKVKPIVEAWNQQNPDEKVTFKELAAEADDQRSTLVQSLQAGNSDYDVMALDVVWVAEFAANGWLAPFEGDLELDTSALLPATVDAGTYFGKLYAAPQNTNAQLLFYRTDLTGGEAPTDWQGLVDSCAAADEAELDCMVTQLKNYEGLTVNATQFIHSWGGKVVGDDGETPALDSDEARAGLQALVDAYDGGVIAERAIGFTEEETNQAFVDGETMYAYNWPYMFDNAAAEESDVAGDFGVAAILGPEGPGASTLGGYNNAINVNSKNQATARDFIEFVLSEDNQRSFAEASFPPVLASVYDDAALIDQFPYLPALKDALDNAQPRPVTPYYDAVSKAIHDNVYAALRGDKSVDEAIDDMTSAIENAVK